MTAFSPDELTLDLQDPAPESPTRGANGARGRRARGQRRAVRCSHVPAGGELHWPGLACPCRGHRAPACSPALPRQATPLSRDPKVARDHGERRLLRRSDRRQEARSHASPGLGRVRAPPPHSAHRSETGGGGAGWGAAGRGVAETSVMDTWSWRRPQTRRCRRRAEAGSASTRRHGETVPPDRGLRVGRGPAGPVGEGGVRSGAARCSGQRTRACTPALATQRSQGHLEEGAEGSCGARRAQCRLAVRAEPCRRVPRAPGTSLQGKRSWRTRVPRSRGRVWRPLAPS